MCTFRADIISFVSIFKNHYKYVVSIFKNHYEYVVFGLIHIYKLIYARF